MVGDFHEEGQGLAVSILREFGSYILLPRLTLILICALIIIGKKISEVSVRILCHS